MAEIEGIRRALGELPPGRTNTRLELRSGESLQGEFVGFDGQVARIRTEVGEESIEAEEVIDVRLMFVSEGPE